MTAYTKSRSFRVRSSSLNTSRICGSPSTTVRGLIIASTHSHFIPSERWWSTSLCGTGSRQMRLTQNTRASDARERSASTQNGGIETRSGSNASSASSKTIATERWRCAWYRTGSSNRNENVPSLETLPRVKTVRRAVSRAGGDPDSHTSLDSGVDRHGMSAQLSQGAREELKSVASVMQD